MSGYVPILVVTILSTGAMVAEAHQSTPRPATQRVFSDRAGHTTAFTGSSAAQSDDVAAKVKGALKADPDLGSQSDAVTVTASGGVITLEGTVPTVQIRAKLGEFVMKVDGVTKMVNKLKLAKK